MYQIYSSNGEGMRTHLFENKPVHVIARRPGTALDTVLLEMFEEERKDSAVSF